MKDTLKFVTDAETLAAIEDNDYHSPVPAQITDAGAWVYAWSLEQFNERSDDSGAVRRE